MSDRPQRARPLAWHEWERGWWSEHEARTGWTPTGKP